MVDEFAVQVLEAEAAAITALIPLLGDAFDDAVARVLACKGRVVITGMGKSGIIAEKISATLCSTGTPSIFLHPAEAIHGDLGRVVPEDLVIALSNSGETAEILALLPGLKKLPVELIGITSRKESALARHSEVLLWIGPVEEACALGLAPSASTTAMLALGDALALTVSHQRNFSREDYARFHPGGSLGRKLLTVGEVMRTDESNAIVEEQVTVPEAASAVMRAKAGAALVIDKSGSLIGIFTDGDLRRLLVREGDLRQIKLTEAMTRDPRTVGPEMLAAEALGLMKTHKIDELPVVSQDGRPLGMLDVQDLLSVGLV